MANKGNGDAELPSDPSSSSLSSKKTAEKNEEMTPNLSSCQTRNNSDTIPNPQSMIKADEESDNKTDKKEKGSVQHSTSSGLPQISRPENVQENEITSSLQDMASSGLPQERKPEIVKMETGKQSSHTNYPKSNLEPDSTVEIKNSSEPEAKQEVEEGKQSSHRKDPESNPDPNITVKIENSNEPEEKQEVTSSLQDITSSGLPLESQTEIGLENEITSSLQDMASSGLPQESQPEIVKMETGKKSSHGNDPQPNPDPYTTVKCKNSSEPGEKQEVEEGKQSSHRKDPESNPDPNITVKIENSNEPEEKQEVTSSLQDITSSGLPLESQTEIGLENEKETIQEQSSHTNDHKSNLEPDSTVEIKNSSELQEKLEVNTESPLNIQKSEEEEEEEEETARDINEENVERDENEVQDQDQNLQSQIAVPGNNKTFWICAVGVFLLAAVCAYMFSPDSTPPKPNEFNVVNVFNQEMEKLETSFPNQRPELWRRSLIHLRRHLKTKSPSEPVSLILTSGHRAEKTLDCLARCLARAFTTALNSSVLNIYGKSKASQDSDQVKLDIDRELRNAFEGEKSAAVIHRFEELPPGSTLIFYRYCDHENAAYKNVFLAFTVMLDAEVEVPSNVSLGRVEEMVQEHIKQKFVSSDKSAVFNQMDVDKLSGLWSRISHLILPVAAEEKIEQQGCGDCDKSF